MVFIKTFRDTFWNSFLINSSLTSCKIFDPSCSHFTCDQQFCPSGFGLDTKLKHPTRPWIRSWRVWLARTIRATAESGLPLEDEDIAESVGLSMAKAVRGLKELLEDVRGASIFP